MLEAQDSLSDWAVRDKGVVLHDRLMTDAALGHAPIKTEHSYSLSDDSADSSPHHGKVDGEYALLYFVYSAGVRNVIVKVETAFLIMDFFRHAAGPLRVAGSSTSPGCLTMFSVTDVYIVHELERSH